MQLKRPSSGLAALTILLLTLFVTNARAASEKKLHNFGITSTDGSRTEAGLIFDSSGNLFGLTSRGGSYGLGTAFELMPNGSGGWTEKKLHNFGNGTDGAMPGGGLIFDATGNLYGTTSQGGSYGGGTVFELIPNGGGWTEKKLHNFGNATDGTYPYVGLVFDSTGNLYGTTSSGGSYGGGIIFELSPNGSGGWTEKKLHNFGNGTDGVQPAAALILDGAGNLYGTTSMGGMYSNGTAFELISNGDGGWSEKKLHNFGINPTDGLQPYGGLVFDQAGNLYGPTYYGGDYPCDGSGCGTLFELSPNGSGGWTEKKLHSFGATAADGINPVPALIFDPAGNLYGTTYLGGSYNGGTVFESTPNGSGGWIEKKLHNFGGGNDGARPDEPVLIRDASGNLYGATVQGGNYNAGLVFEITP